MRTGPVCDGVTLVSVNSRTVESLYAEIRWLFAGSSSPQSFQSVLHSAVLYGGFLGPERTFVVRDYTGGLITYEVGRDSPPLKHQGTLTSRRMDGDIGYIAFDEWTPPMDRRFRETLSALSDTRGLVIDLRGNGGGQASVLLSIANPFFSTRTSFGVFRQRQGTQDTISTTPSSSRYTGAIVILTDARSASASEVFAASMQEAGRAKVVGSQSCGCVLNQWSKALPGGGTLRWSARVYRSPQGRILEGLGVTPDIAVTPTLADLREGRDTQLMEAVRVIATPPRH